jgi:hypothetical protein
MINKKIQLKKRREKQIKKIRTKVNIKIKLDFKR